MKKILSVLITFILVLSFSSCVSKEVTTPENFSDFTVYDYNNNKVSLSDKLSEGKPVVFNYWTTWCPYCLEEMPDFEEVYKEYGDKVSFMMIDVNGGGNDTIPEAKEYIEEMGYSFPVYFDTDLSATYAYGVGSFPTTGVIDAEGNLYYCQAGMLTKDRLITMIDDILK
ncbi:MAG: TlpA family protein disulfide reductase [Clostridia bacterium]|nr:TlpA family protein disulfide reductase [Clostridia bacterium]